MDLADRIPDPGGDHGEVFTRRWVVEMILDLVGYVAERDLASCVLVEPSCDRLGCGLLTGHQVQAFLGLAVIGTFAILNPRRRNIAIHL